MMFDHVIATPGEWQFYNDRAGRPDGTATLEGIPVTLAENAADAERLAAEMKANGVRAGKIGLTIQERQALGCPDWGTAA